MCLSTCPSTAALSVNFRSRLRPVAAHDMAKQPAAPLVSLNQCQQVKSILVACQKIMLRMAVLHTNIIMQTLEQQEDMFVEYELCSIFRTRSIYFAGVAGVFGSR